MPRGKGAEHRAGAARTGPARWSALLDQGRAAVRTEAPRSLERFAVRTRDRFVMVPASDVLWIGAAGNYAELHLANATHLVPFDEPAAFNATVERFFRMPFMKRDRINDMLKSLEKLRGE